MLTYKNPQAHGLAGEYDWIGDVVGAGLKAGAEVTKGVLSYQTGKRMADLEKEKLKLQSQIAMRQAEIDQISAQHSAAGMAKTWDMAEVALYGGIILGAVYLFTK